MIDKEKIEEELLRQVESHSWNTMEEQYSYKDGFEDGVELAQNEFVNSLWHDASEEPKTHTCVVVIMIRELVQYCKIVSNFENWKTDAETLGYTKWCCLDDILPDTVWGF